MRTIHVQLNLGVSFPGGALAARRELVDAIESELDTTCDTGTGGGVADIWVGVTDAAEAKRRIRRIAKRLDIMEWTTLRAEPRSVRVEILCDDAFPIDRAKTAAKAFTAKISAAAIGEPTGSRVEYASGLITIDVEVPNAKVAIAKLEDLARAAGIADRVRIDAR